MMRQEVASFAGLMERKLQENDHKGGWSGDTAQALMQRLREEVEELGLELSKVTVNGSVAAFEAVDVANFAMMIVDVLTGGRMGALPTHLGRLPTVTKPRTSPDVKVNGHWFRWLLATAGADARVLSGRLFAESEEKAMVSVREAALLDKVERPFEITIARLFRVEDETVQKTKEVTE